MKKETLLYVAEYVCLFAFMSTRVFTGEHIWLGVVVTALFGVLHVLLNVKRRKPDRRKLTIELATGTPLFLVYIYIAFFVT